VDKDRSETRLGQDQFETKKIGLGLVCCGLGLAGQTLCCEKRSCYARRHNDVEGHSNFSGTIYSFSILCLEHHTVEINSGIYLLKS